MAKSALALIRKAGHEIAIARFCQTHPSYRHRTQCWLMGARASIIAAMGLLDKQNAEKCFGHGRDNRSGNGLLSPRPARKVHALSVV